MPNVIETTDAPATTATTYTLAVGQTAQGTIASSGDVDFYRVNLVAGQTYTFALTGTGSNSLHDAYLELRDSAGLLISASDDDGPGLMSSIAFTAASSGTYFLAPQAYSTDIGQYGLSVTTGSRASYDAMMGAGVITREDLTWAATTPGAVNVTWSVSASNATQQDASGTATPFIAPSAAQVGAVQSALALYAEVANISFTQINPGGTSNDGTIRINAYNSTTDGAGAYAYFPGSTAGTDIAGDVNINNDSISTTSVPQGEYSYMAILHELGHALGLSHPGDYDAAPGQTLTYATNAQFTQDSLQYTVMSYFDETETNGGVDAGYPDTLMMFDILAIQQLYGVDNTTRSGNTVYGFGSNAGSIYNFATNADPFFCIWDGAGTDTINASLYSMSQRIDLRDGTFSDIGGYLNNVSIAVGAVIENATGGSGADSITGNAANNVLNGGGGTDTMAGGLGNDVYVTDGGDTITEAVGAGADIVQSSVTYTLGANLEHLVLLGSANINGTGNTLSNNITGNSGNNTLNGGGGTDLMLGGIGNDIYVTDGGDTIIENAGAGTDIVQSSVTLALGANLEHLVLLGSANINGTGNSGNNNLTGNSGNNVLNGAGGTDTMVGGLGNDVYVTDGGDTIVENAGGGTSDIVQSSVTYALGANLEHLVLLGSANINGTGNSGNNNLTGNAANNVLNGLAGNDILMGAAGQDTFAFSTSLGATNIDRILDFNVADDQILLGASTFSAIGAGVLAATAFIANTTGLAQDASDRIIYETDSGAIWYDSDGLGGVAAVQFATVTANLGITNADFFVA